MRVAVENGYAGDARTSGDVAAINTPYADNDRVFQILPFRCCKLNLRLADEEVAADNAFLKRDAVGTWVVTATVSEAEAIVDGEALTADESTRDDLIAARVL